MHTNQTAIDGALDELRVLVDEDGDLREEFDRSRCEFFRAPGDLSNADGDELAARRHLEWFLFERESEQLGAIPAEALLQRVGESAEALSADRAQAFLGSFCGVFEVTGVESGEGLWLRDLAGRGEYAIFEPEASQVLRTGDLIVGRLFPVGDSLHHISRAASFFRNADLAAALRTDLERARENRRGVLRLSQREIESMFYAPHASANAGDAVGEARRMLLEGGVDRDRVEEIFEELASASYDRDSILPETQGVLGEVLDQLAFDSTIDLDEARRALLSAWAELSRRGPGKGASLPAPVSAAHVTPTTSLKESVAAYERELKNGASLAKALNGLELALSESSDGETSEEEETPAPDFPGVVAAMVEEFLWESEREVGAERTRELECIRSFGRFAASVGVFENLSVHDLVEYACRWLPENDETRNADEARRHLNALREFCRWSETNHALRLYSELKPAWRSLHESLARLAEANRRRTRGSDPKRGELFELLSLESGFCARVRNDRGIDQDVEIDADLGAWLRSGDRLRGRVLTDRRLAVYGCYPAPIEILRHEPPSD
jgi:hypothetical protein